MKYLHSMLRVQNLEQSLDFFCNKLGLVEVKRNEYPDGRFTLVFLMAADDVEKYQGGETTSCAPAIELTYNWDTSPYDNGRNFGHLAFAVDDLYATCQQLMDHGIVINRPPRDGYMAFIKSPDGISIELLQKGKALPTQAPWKDMENIGDW